MGSSDFRGAKDSQPLYSGGDGGSVGTAVVTNAASSLIGVAAEYEYVAQRHGKRNVPWTLASQMAMQHDGRHYDVLDIKLSNGESRSYYFDITKFYGKFLFRG